MPQHDIYKQVAGDPQAPQINLMCEQHTELPNGKYIKEKTTGQAKASTPEKMENKDLQANARRILILDWPTNTRIGVANAEILLILKGSSAQPNNTSAKHATSLATTQAYASKKHNKKQSNYMHRRPTAHQLKAWYHTCT